jgi:hypothetical protein
MVRCIVKRIITLALSTTLFCLLSSSTLAAVDEYQAVQKKQGQVPWRNSTFIYENSFSAYSLSKSADPTYNPYYSMSLDFKPRFYLRDDLSLRLRVVMDTELTVPDDDHRRFLLGDISLDAVYAPSFLTIPYADIVVSPNIRFTFPSSIVSQGRSMIMNIGPGLSFSREIQLLKGRFLQNIGLMYSFRATKELNRYSTAQVDEREGCYNLSRPECQHTGARNRSWRFTNSFEVKVQVMEKLALTLDFIAINDLLHGLPAETTTLGNGISVDLPSSDIDSRASAWGIFDVSYDLLDWLWLSAGTSTLYAQLQPDSSLRTPFFNRATNFYFDVTIPIDIFVNQVQSWTGWGKDSRQN